MNSSIQLLEAFVTVFCFTGLETIRCSMGDRLVPIESGIFRSASVLCKVWSNHNHNCKMFICKYSPYFLAMPLGKHTKELKMLMKFSLDFNLLFN